MMDRLGWLFVALLCVTACTRPEAPPASPSATATASEVVDPLGAGRPLEHGVVFHEVQMPRQPPMKLWVYLPESPGEEKLPCVLIAPAGSPMIVGMPLAEGDRPEHLPYARAGFAVVAYEIDGPIPDEPSDAQFMEGVRRFQAARAGVANAELAMEFALEHLPVDPDRIYVAGHSSAGTLALQCAWSLPGIRACVAYAPGTNVEAHLGEFADVLEEALPGTRDFLVDWNPARKAGTIPCPVFLFWAQDDGLVPAQELDALEEQLGQVDRVTVPTGGHYEAMLSDGIPAAIEWLRTH